MKAYRITICLIDFSACLERSHFGWEPPDQIGINANPDLLMFSYSDSSSSSHSELLAASANFLRLSVLRDSQILYRSIVGGDFQLT